jgi:hypothetical protein
MRTKALLLTAAIGAVGLSSAMAQVYSVNAVGFVNVDLPVGFWIISNPLNNTTSNKIADLFKGAPEAFTVYKYGSAGWIINSYELGQWTDEAATLVPGEGAFVSNPGPAVFKVTFVGEVKQGNLSHAIPAGLSLQSSEVPQAGKLSTDLKFPAVDDDVVYRYDRGGIKGYSIFSVSFGAWDTEPTVEVAEGYWVSKAAAGTWARTFSISS